MEPVDPGSYDAIAPLIETIDRDGDWLKCIFRCPLTGVRIEAQAKLEAAKEKTRSRTKTQRLLAGAVRNALGGDKQSEAGKGRLKLSQSEMQRAVQRAFRSVQTRFVWEAGKRWISTEAAGYVLPEFIQLCKTAPVIQEHDRKLLGRMLLEVAGADAPFDRQKRAIIDQFVKLEPSELVEMAGMTPLTAQDLAGASSGLARDTMLMLTWSIALSDRALSDGAAERIGNYARGLGILPPRAAELKHHAQSYLVDQALERAYGSGDKSAAFYIEAMKLATSIGLDLGTAEQIDARLRKRLGVG